MNWSALGLMIAVLGQTLQAFPTHTDRGSSIPTGSDIAGVPGIVRNDGQIIDTDHRKRSDVLYTCALQGTRLYFRNDGISYVFVQSSADEHPGDEPVRPISMLQHANARPMRSLRAVRLDMTFNRSPGGMIPEGVLPRTDRMNFYYAHCPDGITNVPIFGGVIYRNVWPLIDVRYELRNGRLKSSCIVHPGGDPSMIGWAYTEGTTIAINPDGSMRIASPGGAMQEAAPVSFQGGVVIPTRYRVEGTCVRFEVGPCRSDMELVIDPWATYYGGAEPDRAFSVSTDPAGNVYMTGETGSGDFPANPGAYQSTLSAGPDGFLVKFSPQGNRLWATYFGGTGYDYAYAVAASGSTSVYLTGTTSSVNFPVSTGAFQTVHVSGGAMGYDVFLAKFSATGTRTWATYYGGNNDDYGFSVASNAAGDVYITGATESTNFPVSAGAFQTLYAGNQDAFLVKFNASGTRQWATYYGGSTPRSPYYDAVGDAGYAMALDPSGNVIVAGGTVSTDFPVSAGAYQTTKPVWPDYRAFLFKFNQAGTRLWATHYNSLGTYTLATGVATDNASNIFVSIAQHCCAGMIGKFNVTGTLQWERYPTVPTGGTITAEAVAVDPAGNAVLVGYGEQMPNYQGSGDAYWAKYTSSGTLICHSCFGGGNNFDLARGVAADAFGNVYIVGETLSTDFPATGGLFQPAHAGTVENEDAFLFKLGAGCGGQQDDLFISLKILLAGPWNGTAMNTFLNSQHVLPLTQPYSGSPWYHAGTEHVGATFFASNPSIVDWVLVEARTGDPTQLPMAVVGTRAALLKSDGSIVDTDGSSPLVVPGIDPGLYYFVIRHRNHLAVMSASAVAMTTVAVASYDFTTASTMAYGPSVIIAPQKQLATGKYGLYSGDGNADGGINAGDQNAVWRGQYGNPGYLAGDFNLDGSANAGDINSYWRPHNGMGTQVP
jgi:hypothetical protein